MYNTYKIELARIDISSYRNLVIVRVNMERFQVELIA